MKKEKQIANYLIDYYKTQGRDLPWRHNRNPYRVWISEIMLQQTRVEAVKSYYERFLRELPDIQALANVEDDFLMTLWEGLGYYSRARNLKKCAMEVCEKWQGEMPTHSYELETLSGIGKYTAAAIASFCFNENIAALDGNGLRVFARLYGIEENVLSKRCENQIRELMQACVEDVSSSDFNQAVMDFASAICTPRNSAKCEECGLREICVAYQNNQVETLPIRLSKQTKKEEQYTVLLYRYQDEILLMKREEEGLLAGLYGFDMLDGVKKVEELYENYKEICGKVENIVEIGQFSHVFSHKIWKMSAFVIQCNHKINKKGDWVKLSDIAGKYALPTAFSKIIQNSMQQ